MYIVAYSSAECDLKGKNIIYLIIKFIYFSKFLHSGIIDFIEMANNISQVVPKILILKCIYLFIYLFISIYFDTIVNQTDGIIDFIAMVNNISKVWPKILINLKCIYYLFHINVDIILIKQNYMIDSIAMVNNITQVWHKILIILRTDVNPSASVLISHLTHVQL